MKQSLILALFLGSISLSEAVLLEKRHHHKKTAKWYTTKDPHEENIDKAVQRYSDAADGNYKTEKQYAEEAAAIHPANVYKKDPNFKVAEDDTGEKYVTTHRCFGGPCKDEKTNLMLSKYSDHEVALEGLPWEHNQFFNDNDADL